MSTQDKYSLKKHLLVESLSPSELTNLATLLTGTIENVNTGATLGETLEHIRSFQTHEIPFSTPYIVELETTPELAQAIAQLNPPDLVQKTLPDGWVESNYLTPG